MTELDRKLGYLRRALDENDLAAIRFRGIDWFAWATCGGSSTVLLAAESGVAEVLVTRDAAWALTDSIEADRLREEEVPAGLEVWQAPWNDYPRRESFIREVRGAGRMASDRPYGDEVPLPEGLRVERWSLEPEEVERYRALGREASQAMSEVLFAARPDWTGFQLAGAGAEAMWERGLEPLLTLVGDERRLPLHRHATAKGERLGDRAMLVFCARRHGLIASLTRFVYFREPTAAERKLNAAVAQVEAAVWRASRPGVTLGEAYDAIVAAYADTGHPGGELGHHQGGTAGYSARDNIGLPGSPVIIQENNALAWNPSLPGAKIEDTVIVSGDRLEIITDDPAWPHLTVDGLRRPDLLVR